jgi:hypothetical protein
MNRSAPGQIHLAIVGASGMVGGYALRYALDHPSVGLVTVIGRRKLGISHPRLKEVLHQDFADCTALDGALSDQNAAVFCLGVYTGAVPDAEFRKITIDYAVEFARDCRRILRRRSRGDHGHRDWPDTWQRAHSDAAIQLPCPASCDG